MSVIAELKRRNVHRMAGLYLAVTLYFLKSAALVPLKDPRLPESIAFENA